MNRLYYPYLIQSLTLISSSHNISGKLRIAFEGDATSHLSMSCTAHEMKNALESIPSIGSILVSRNEILNEYVWSITFWNYIGDSILYNDMNLLLVSMDQHTIPLSIATKNTGATNSTDYFIYVRKEIDAY